MTGPIAVTYH